MDLFYITRYKRQSMTLQELMQNQKLNFLYKHVRDQRDSGLTIKDYCEQNNIDKSTFYHCQRKSDSYYVMDYNRIHLKMR